MPTKEKESKVKYASEIITLNETYENATDLSQVPVFDIENCEVLYSSLSSKMAKYGHSIQILLPVGCNLPQIDRGIRQKYLTSIQNDSEHGNPNLELVKGSIKAITDKDILNGKYPEKYSGRYYLDVRVSNTVMFDQTFDEEGKEHLKKITKAEEAEGTPIVKYFRAIDKWSGEGVNPEIFKYENGEKVTTFISPKTKQETPLYVNGGDTINISIRPFGTKAQNTGDYSLKYNLLKIEIVQTAWDKGIGRNGGGSSKRTFTSSETVNLNDLGSIFGGIEGVVVETAPKPTKTAKKVVEETTEKKVEKTVVKENTTQEASDDVEIDFSALNNLDMSNLNLGE